MRRWLALFGMNVAITAISLVVWAVVGFLLGSIFAALHEPTVPRYLLSGGSALTTDLERFYAIRGEFVRFFAWCGLVCAQVVFVIHHFGGVRDHPPGGFPVKEL